MLFVYSSGLHHLFMHFCLSTEWLRHSLAIYNLHARFHLLLTGAILSVIQVSGLEWRLWDTLMGGHMNGLAWVANPILSVRYVNWMFRQMSCPAKHVGILNFLSFSPCPHFGDIPLWGSIFLIPVVFGVLSYLSFMLRWLGLWDLLRNQHNSLYGLTIKIIPLLFWNTLSTSPSFLCKSSHFISFTMDYLQLRHLRLNWSSTLTNATNVSINLV